MNQQKKGKKRKDLALKNSVDLAGDDRLCVG